ncbi:DUF4334 domain-containing protein [Devosia sediminis]|uniref:DUF4334 domain-containing protein n=1 Tax=Devosia sediminis TaxID=2798801 RepID=A0A934IXS9_9HYPH|nr:DUF4334 domain-containing protein [Devosia sediminis]MBJ3784693.1 DUF4334 domain-containing protein [Devosia sediminis]
MANTMTSAQSGLAELEPGTDANTALEFFDGLKPTEIEDLIGNWRGTELPTGHRLDGLLAKAGWHGKRFDDSETVHPLVFERPDGSLFAIDPAWLPMSLLTSQVALAQRLARPGLVRLASAFARTTRPRARLRMTRFRDVVSATMIYDALPINDVFRTVDADTVVGAMDMRGYDVPYFFVLRREGARPLA